MNNFVSVIIPIYNAKDVLEESLRRIDKAFAKIQTPYEIVLRDDASRDGSAKIMAGLQDRYRYVRCFYNSQNRGIGYTIRELVNGARGDRVIYTDCDLPFQEDIFAALISHLGEHDIVLASRYRGIGSRVNILRRVLSRLYYYLCRLLFRITVLDIGSGTVAFKKEAVKALELKSDGFAFHVEMYLKAKRRGLSVKEIAANHTPSSTGSFRILRHGFGVVTDTLRLFSRL